MSKQPRGMGGRGLAALIPTSPPVVRSAAPSATATMVAEESAPQHHQSGLKPVDGAYFLEIPIGRIEPNPRQPRDIFDEEALKELATSISEVGLLQPIVVRATGEETLRAGHGRAPLASLQARRPLRDPRDRTEHAGGQAPSRRVDREPPARTAQPLEEAAAYRQLLDDFGATHEQLATRVGRSRSHVTNTLRLLNLPPKVQLRVSAGTISAGHARALLTLADPKAQERLADRIVAELLSVRAVEEIVAVGDATAAPAPTTRAPGRSRPRSRLSATSPTVSPTASRPG